MNSLSNSNSSNSDVNIERNNSWRGCSIKEIHRNLSEWKLKHVPSIHPSDNHTVLYHWPLLNSMELPKPQKGHDKWDSLHVRLPCSSKNQYPVTQNDGTLGIESRWLMIEKALLRPITNSRELETAILSYNSKYENIWKFRTLHKLFEEELEEDEAAKFFDDLLPKIIRLALRLPELITTSIPLLKQGQNRSLSLSQQQVGCLLANAFLCTFPRRNTTKKKSEYSSFPNINFNRLFQSPGHHVIEKIKCILHYFRRICDKMPTGVITFTRRSLTESELPNWEENTSSLGSTLLHVTSCGTIESEGQGLLQVDFANKFVGGGVLRGGCVQEEIRFVICPELIVSKLFTEVLKPFEALITIGCEQFSKYVGYASSFVWNGDYKDNTPFDESGRRQCYIVAIDALHFSQSSYQYREESMLRELNKAYVGFLHPLDTPAPGVASGNWGCGAFGGDSSLKALIQLMVCTVTKRPLVYFTFGNQELRENLYKIHKFFTENNVKVKELWKYLKEFQNHNLPPNNLYNFIIQRHCDLKRNEEIKLNRKEKKVEAQTQELMIINDTKDNLNERKELTVKRNLNSDKLVCKCLHQFTNETKKHKMENLTSFITFGKRKEPELTSKNLCSCKTLFDLKQENDKKDNYLSKNESVGEELQNNTEFVDSQKFEEKTQKTNLKQISLLDLLDMCYDKEKEKRNENHSKIAKEINHNLDK